jgi:hypothetical protein
MYFNRLCLNNLAMAGIYARVYGSGCSQFPLTRALLPAIAKWFSLTLSQLNTALG